MTPWESLLNELSTDPLTIGYAGMTDQQRLDSLTDDTARPRDVESISSADLFEFIDRTEWDTNTPDAAFKERLDRLLALDTIIVSPGSNGRAELTALFSGGSWPNTVAAITAAVLNQTQSRAQELGLGTLGLGMLETARAALGG